MSDNLNENENQIALYKVNYILNGNQQSIDMILLKQKHNKNSMRKLLPEKLQMSN